MSEDTKGNKDRIVLSTAGEKGLPAVLVADRENVALLICFGTRDGQTTFEFLFDKLESLDGAAKALLLESLAKAADFVAASMTCALWLPECQQITASPLARLWGSLRRRLLNKQHVLKMAAKQSFSLVAGIRTVEPAGMEVIFEEGLLEALLNVNGKGRLLEGLRRAAYVVECRGGSRASGVA